MADGEIRIVSSTLTQDKRGNFAELIEFSPMYIVGEIKSETVEFPEMHFTGEAPYRAKKLENSETPVSLNEGFKHLKRFLPNAFAFLNKNFGDTTLNSH